MKRFLLHSGLFLVISLSLAGSDKKYERIMARANAFYAHFAYQKAIELYVNALEIKHTQEPMIQIANCYLNISKPEDAKGWFEKAMELGELPDNEMLHYGQLLSKLESYDSASLVLEKYDHQGDWVISRSQGFKNVQKFYLNEIAYEVLPWPYNTKYADFSPTIRHDKKVVFVSGRPSRGWFKSKFRADNSLFLNLFQVDVSNSSNIDGEEPEPLKMPRGINTRFHEGPSQFLYFDQKIIFTRNNYNNHEANLSVEGVNGLKMYTARKRGTSLWHKPEEFEFNNDDYSVGHPTLTENAQTLYFASDMPGGFGGVDIYKSVKKNGKWTEPENLGSKINTPRDEMYPYISNNGFLYFSSDGHAGLGGLDIFRVDLEGPNSKPRNMGFAMNSHNDDFGITLDLKNGNQGYFSSNRKGGMGNDDIYAVKIYDHIVTVNLRDKETEELILGRIKAFDPVMEEVIRDQEPISTIKFPALAGDQFDLNGMSTGFIPDSLHIKLEENTREIRSVVFDIYLRKPGANVIVYVVEINQQSQQVLYVQKSKPELILHNGNFAGLEKHFEEKFVTIDSVIYLNNVLYDFDKHNIREDARESLDKWVVFLNQYPDEKVSLSSHTDARGTNKYNRRLARRRVESAVSYLMNAGISRNRFVERSFGEEQLWETCSEEECNEVQHQNNRRTEVLIERAD